MAITPIDVDHGPLSHRGYLVLSFDPRNAQLAVHGDYSYAEGNKPEAVEEARHAAEQAAGLGLPLQYVVVRVSPEDGYRPAGA